MRRLEPIAILRSVLVLVAVAHILIVVVVSLRRMVHPFELEWMEGAMVDHVERVLQGKRLYVEPSVEFVPFIYGPLYFWVSAGVAKVVGLSFLPLRIVSIASMLGSFGLLYAIVKRETEDRVAGVVAAGAFAATYVKSAQFLDIGRVDSFSLVLSLGAIFILRNLRARRMYWVLSAVLLAFSFLTKQSSFLVALALIAHELWTERRRAIPFAVVTLVLSLGTASVIDWVHSGWFRYYTWELPRSHPFVKHSLAGFWTDDLFPTMAIGAVFAAFYLIAAKPRREGARLFHMLAAGGMLASSWTGRLHDGGWPNVLIPAFAGLAVLFGLGVAEALRMAEAQTVQLRSFVLVAAATQLAVLFYDPTRVVPRPRDTLLGWAFIAQIRDIPGDVFIPNHSWYARMAGKPAHAHRMAMDDVFRGDPYGSGPSLATEVRVALNHKRWAAVVLDDDFFAGDAMRNYSSRPVPFASKEGFFPVTGIHIRPRDILLREP